MPIIKLKGNLWRCLYPTEADSEQTDTSGDQSVVGGKSAAPETEQILIPTETQRSQTADYKCKFLCTEHRTMPAESLEGNV